MSDNIEYSKTATAGTRVPLRYKCEYCGREHITALLLEARSTATSDFSSHGLRAQAEKSAGNKLNRLVKRRLKSVNEYHRLWGLNMPGECPICRHVQPWNELKGFRSVILPAAITLLVCALCASNLPAPVNHPAVWGSLCVAVITALIVLVTAHGYKAMRRLGRMADDCWPILKTDETEIYFTPDEETGSLPPLPQADFDEARRRNHPVYVLLNGLAALLLLAGAACRYSPNVWLKGVQVDLPSLGTTLNALLPQAAVFFFVAAGLLILRAVVNYFKGGI